MSVDVVYTVTCDGPCPCGDCDLDCEAEFDHAAFNAIALLDRIEALEAAAPNLVQVGWFTPGMPEGVDVGSLVDGQCSDDDEPVYRIVPGAAGPAGDPETTDG